MAVAVAANYEHFSQRQSGKNTSHAGASALQCTQTGLLLYVLVSKTGEEEKSMLTRYGNLKSCRAVNIWLSDF